MTVTDNIAISTDSGDSEFGKLCVENSLEARLRHFLDQARPMLAEFTETVLATAPAPVKIDIANFAGWLPDLAVALNAARSRGEGINPWVVAGLRQNEVRNVGVLSALWDPQLCGDEAKAFLIGFLARIPSISDEIRKRVEAPTRYWVRTEDRSIEGEKDRRADITIEGSDFYLIIEAKIYSGESGVGQYSDCAQAADRWSERNGGNPAAFILLGLSKVKPKEFEGLYATWADVAAAARERLPKKRGEFSFHSDLIDNFVRHISRF